MNRGEQTFPFSESYNVLMKARTIHSYVWIHKIYKEMKALDKLRSEPMMTMRVLNELLRRYPINGSELHSQSLQDRMIGKLCMLQRDVIETAIYGLSMMGTYMEIEQYLVDYIAHRVKLTEELVSQSPEQILQFICDHRRAKLTELELARITSEDESTSDAIRK